MQHAETIKEQLRFIYGEQADAVFTALQQRLSEFKPPPAPGHDRVDETDAILITYGDQIEEHDKPTLQSLAQFADTHLTDMVNSIHILPFYPYSSDDGFSVIDYKAVAPIMGDWPDVTRLGQNFRLMFDAVINHISAESDWFIGFLWGKQPYVDYFITVEPTTDLSMVTRPRALPLLTPVETPRGTQYVWTTFSDDQIDLNYANPKLLLEIIDVLLFYVAHGAEFIRLDAIAYMWKELGTPCIHRPETHRIIQLFRAVLDEVAPHVLLITETNVPHAENISYFGDGKNEAQLVYNFTLAPLILHTFHSGNAEVLQQWAASLETPSDRTHYFNFIASHDGLGVRPAEGILNPRAVQTLVDKTVQHGGQVSYKTNPDGSKTPYELNITLFDALSDPHDEAEPEARKISRFMAAQAIMLALSGVPGIYIHSLIGSSNNLSGLAETGRARTINREKWLWAEIEAQLDNPDSRARQIYEQYRTLLQARAAHKAFHPNGAQQIITDTPPMFNILRTAPDESEQVLCLHNITNQPQQYHVNISELLGNPNLTMLHDLLSAEQFPVTPEGRATISLPPYGVRWLKG